MGLFSRKPSDPPMQLPDELAQQAALRFGNQDFYGALQAYAEAIDKIHTMCVAAPPSSRIRTPGPQDQPVLDGFNHSLAAAIAVDPARDVVSIVRGTVHYLREIADEAGPESERYRRAIDEMAVGE